MRPLISSRNFRNTRNCSFIILRCHRGSKGPKARLSDLHFRVLEICFGMTAIILENKDIDRMGNLKENREEYKGSRTGDLIREREVVKRIGIPLPN